MATSEQSEMPENQLEFTHYPRRFGEKNIFVEYFKLIGFFVFNTYLTFLYNIDTEGFKK